MGDAKLARYLLAIATLVTIFAPNKAWAVFSARPYFPLQSGNSWTYLANGVVSETATVLPGTTLVNGVATKARQESSGATDYFTNDGSGIRLHRQFEPGVFIPGLGTVDLTVTFNPPILIANAMTDIGQTVDSSGTADTNLGSLTYNASFTVQAFDNVATPLRNFAVVRIQGEIELCDGGTCESVTENLYVARNVGVVKEIEVDGSTDTLELSGTNLTPESDYDADVRSDTAVYQTNTGHWFFVGSSSGFGQQSSFGGSIFLPVAGDYDGDGETDTAVYDTTNGNWFINRSTAGFHVHPGFGGSGFIPVPGDYDGDGKTDVAVYETSTGHWFFVGSTSGFGQQLAFGGPGFIPVPGDYDGDGETDAAVYDTTNGNWFINRSSAGFHVHPGFGGSGFIPVPGDYDGDGKTDVAVYETSTGHWFFVGSTSGFGQQLAFGGPGFIPVPGDHDGDGITDTAVYEVNTGHWFIAQSTAGFRVNAAFGGSGFVPVLLQVTILGALGLL
jgi:hypothetical protein